MIITFVDTSVLCNFLGVPGLDQDKEAVRTEFHDRSRAGERFVVPITAVIETGNHVANVKPPRRDVADRFTGLLNKILAGDLPWVLNTVEWGESFVAELLAGDDTGESFLDLAGTGRMGAGDISILVERDDFLARSAFAEAAIWSLDSELNARS